MRILQVITPSRFSGAERVCVEIAEDLSELGHQVAVVSKPSPPLVRALEACHVPCHIARIGGKFNFAAPLVIARIARRMKADLIHAHLSSASVWGALAGRLLGVPSIAHVHACNTAVWYCLATHLIAVCGAVRDYMIAGGTHPDRVSVVHNAVDVARLTERQTDGRLRAALGVRPEECLLVVAAHLSPKKGHRVLLAALRLLADRGLSFRCLCLGDGPELQALEALAGRLDLGNRVAFLGFRDDAADIVRESDVALLPSIRGEGLPLSLLEAAALARPTVASRLAGIPDAIADGQTGYVVEPGDAQALAERIEALVADAGLRERMGRAARQRAYELFDRERRARAVEQVYAQVLAQSRAPTPARARAAEPDGESEPVAVRRPR